MPRNSGAFWMPTGQSTLVGDGTEELDEIGAAEPAGAAAAG